MLVFDSIIFTNIMKKIHKEKKEREGAGKNR